MGFFNTLFKSLSSKKYRKNPNDWHLTADQQRAINIGAINSEQTMYYCDSLETGDYPKTVASKLSSFYDICDIDTAHETLYWFMDEGHRHAYEKIKVLFASSMINGWRNKLNMDDTDIDTVITHLSNLDSAFQVVIDNGFIKDKAAFGDIDIMAWDMGRLVNVTRACVDCGYITADEAWPIIAAAYANCKDIYENWEQFAQGYIVGRAMWGGNNMTLLGIISITEKLKADSESPWNLCSFK